MALGAPELVEDIRFKEFHSRVSNVIETRRVIQDMVSKLTRDEAMNIFEAGDVPCSLVRTVAEVRDDKHFRDRGSLLPMRHGKIEGIVPGISSGFPVLFSGGEIPEPYGAPTLGQQNAEIYGKLLDIDEEALARLKSEGIV